MDLPDPLKQALCRLGENPTVEVVTDDLLRQLIALGLIEATHAGGVRFTDAGKQEFRKLRGTLPDKNA